MSQEVTTTVNKETVQGPFPGKYGEFMKLVWDTDAGQFSKILKKDEDAPEFEGKNVHIVHTGGKYQNIVEYNEVTGGAKAGKKKVDVSTHKEPDHNPYASTHTTKGAPTGSYKDNSNGQRNGMITGRAVELAVARGETDLEGMQQAALDVKALADFVEKQS